MSFCIVIPVYRALNDPLEIVSFLRLNQFVHKDVFLVAPEGLSLESYNRLWPSITECRFPPHHFDNIAAYNALMLSQVFYQRFANNYEWMLVHQLDAFLFHADFTRFSSLPYDYFGAPWIQAQRVRPGIQHPRLLQLIGRKVSVGNGGLSLRRLEPTLRLLMEKEHAAVHWKTNEDGFYAYYGKKSTTFRACSVEVANRFAMEREPEVLLERNDGNLPLGCHGFNKISQNIYAGLINPLLVEIDGLSAALGDRQLPFPYEYMSS